MSLVAVAESVLDKSLLLGYSRLGPAVRKAWWPDDPHPEALIGKHVVVTGGSSGLGRAAATGIARLGATVHLVGRNLDRLEQSADLIRADVPGALLVSEECDVSDVGAARRYGERLTAELDQLHAIVHDAGVMPPERTESAQGHEMALATHVIGPIALTEAARPVLDGTPDSRVVVVTSGGMYSAPLDESIGDDIEYRRGQYEGIRAYARSKRIQVLMTERLAERYARDGITVHAMHPGWADTPGVTDSLPRFARYAAPILRTPEQGADTIVWLTASPAATESTGLLWCDRRPRPTTYLPWSGEDPVVADIVWSHVSESAGVIGE